MDLDAIAEVQTLTVDAAVTSVEVQIPDPFIGAAPQNVVFNPMDSVEDTEKALQDAYGSTDLIVTRTEIGSDVIYTLRFAGQLAGHDFQQIELLNGSDVVVATVVEGTPEDGFFVLNTQGRDPADDFGIDDDTVDASESTLPLVIFGGMGDDDITGGQAEDIIFGDRGRVLFFADPTSVDLSQPLDVLEPLAATVLGHGHLQVVEDGDIVPGDKTDGIVRNPLLVVTVDVTIGGNDTIHGSGVPSNEPDNDLIFGGGNNGFVLLSQGTAVADTIFGDEGDDILFGDFGRVIYTDGLPTLIETIDTDHGGDDLIVGDAGDDLILGGPAADRIDGDVHGDDTATGDDTILGDVGFVLLWNADELPFDPKRSLTTDRIYHIESSDHPVENSLRVDGGPDRITAGPGQDIVIGGADGDFLDGDSDEDLMIGDNARLNRFGRVGDFTQFPLPISPGQPDL